MTNRKQKWCSACESNHPATKSVFGVNKRNKDGLGNICKDGRRKQRAQHGDATNGTTNHVVDNNVVRVGVKISIVIGYFVAILGAIWSIKNGAMGFVGLSSELPGFLNGWGAFLTSCAATIGTAWAQLLTTKNRLFVVVWLPVLLLNVSVDYAGVFRQKQISVLQKTGMQQAADLSAIDELISIKQDVIDRFPTKKRDGDFVTWSEEAKDVAYNAMVGRDSLAEIRASMKLSRPSEPEKDVVFWAWLIMPHLLIITGIYGVRKE